VSSGYEKVSDEDTITYAKKNLFTMLASLSLSPKINFFPASYPLCKILI
jgi:hypothetical protein